METMIPECVIFTSGNERMFTEERTNIRALRLYQKSPLTTLYMEKWLPELLQKLHSLD